MGRTTKPQMRQTKQIAANLARESNHKSWLPRLLILQISRRTSQLLRYWRLCTLHNYSCVSERSTLWRHLPLQSLKDILQ